MTTTFSRAGQFIRSRRFPIFTIVFVDVLGLRITLPVLPLFAKNQLHAEAWQITALTSIYFTAQFFASPVLGRLSDRVGRRPVLILSQAGTLAALLMTGSAPAIFLLYVARTIDGTVEESVGLASPTALGVSISWQTMRRHCSGTPAPVQCPALSPSPQVRSIPCPSVAQAKRSTPP